MNADEMPAATPDRVSRPSAALGHAIRRARSGRYTLAQLSERAGVSAGILSLIERGHGNPSINTLASIAEALDISLPELVADAIAHSRGSQPLVATLQDASMQTAPSEQSAPGRDLASAGEAGDAEAGVQTAWRTSVILQGGQEAHVRVLDGTLELTLHDRTAGAARAAQGERRLSVDLSLRSATNAAALQIPPAEDPRWLEFARGDIPFEPATLACQMLFTHVVRCVRQDPSSPNVERWVRELRGFFVKYEAVSGPELAQVFG